MYVFFKRTVACFFGERKAAVFENFFCNAFHIGGEFMLIHFLGADHEVTGSMHFVEAAGLNILVDCGMEQGANHYENAPLPIKYAQVDYILLTHAHIDHAGMIPYAFKNGFHGTVVTTKATEALAEIMLRDSAHIQMQEAEYRNRKGKRSGKEKVEPIYDLNDAVSALSGFRGVDYGETVELGEGIRIRFIDAGHLLGSASIEMWITEQGITKKLVFSGDIGNFDKPLIRDPEYIHDADYVLMESTYGNRFHDESVDHIADLVSITQRTLDRGGNVIIPAFAVGRTQELLYLYRQIKEQKLIRGHDHFPVYVDSPLAVEATHIFSANLKDCYDDETREVIERGVNPIAFRGLNLAITLDESKAINYDEEPKVIISASGMCDAGRVRHHIKYNLWRPECTIVFAGYQAEGTLGRILQDGADSVRLFGEDIVCRAEIAKMADMSSHADQNGLMEWISAYDERKPDKVFLVHGDDEAMETLSQLIREKTGLSVDCPYSGSIFDLMSGKWIAVAEPKKIVKSDLIPGMHGRRRASDSAYERLMSAYNKLLAAVQANYGGANKDLAKFTDQILNLYDKWIR